MPEMPVMASPGALFAMCAAMMTAMMLPGALLQIARRGVLFGAGYLLVWTGFSAVATLVQVELDRAGLLSEAMALRSVPLAALVVAAAGLYQFAPSKRACLARCRIQGAENIGMAPGCSHHNRRWRALRLLVRELLLGADGAALRAGMMNIAWLVAITAFVVIEKTVPRGAGISKLAGVALVAGGAVIPLAR